MTFHPELPDCILNTDIKSLCIQTSTNTTTDFNTKIYDIKTCLMKKKKLHILKYVAKQLL